MNTFHPSEVAIAGITYEKKWYSGPLKSIKHTDKVRGDLILYAIKFATGVGYKVVVVDGGSAKTLIAAIKKIPGVKIFKAKFPKRSPNRRRAIFESSKIPGVKAIVMTEFEKVSVITDCIEMIVSPVLHHNADLVVPKRETALFQKSVPPYMFESEVEGNLLYCEALRANGLLSTHAEDLDVFFGVRVFKNDPKLLKMLFSHYESNPFNSLLAHRLFDFEEYSNGQFFPVVKALQKKKEVVSVTVPFVYPQSQMENELKGQRDYFILKRRYQRLTILVELMHFLGYINNEATRKISKVKSDSY